MRKLLASVSFVALAACAPAIGTTASNPLFTGPVTSDGQPDMNANYLPLPDGSQLRAWRAVTAADQDGLFQYGLVGTARTYPGGRTEVMSNPMYNQSEGGFWANAGVGVVQSGAAELGGLIFLGQHQPSSNITIAGNNNGGAATGGAATANSSSVSSSKASASVNSSIHNSVEQSQGQAQGQFQFLSHQGHEVR